MLASFGSALAYQGTEPLRAHVENLTVMIDAYFADDPNPEWGTGIIASLRDSTLTILTATHVYQPRGSVIAKRIDIHLRWMPSARVLEARPVKAVGDLAVLQVTLPDDALPPPDTLLFSALGEAASISREEGLRPLGHGRGEMWATCLGPDAFDKRLDDAIVFESKCIESGHSGGPLVDESWRIIGMVRVDQQPIGVASAIGPLIATVKSWGLPVDLEEVSGKDENRFSAVSAGVSVACGLTLKNRVFCWGSNEKSALGAGTERSFDALVGLPLADRHRFSAVSAGGHYGCAITLGGATLCWGQISDINGPPRPKPVAIPGDPGFRSISAGVSHACGVTAEGAGYCWGSNSRGQLGDGTTKDNEKPVRVAGLQVWRQISAGANITCGLTRASRAYCWGDYSRLIRSIDGQDTVRTPAVVAADREWLEISANRGVDWNDRDIRDGTKFVCGIGAADQKAYCWGRGAYDWAKRSDTNPTAPLVFAAEHQFASISSGSDYVCGTTTESLVLCWGQDHFDSARDPNPHVVADGVAVSAGDQFSCALRKDGRVGCWGFESKRMGIGGSPDSRTQSPRFPVRVSHCEKPEMAEQPRQLSIARQFQNRVLQNGSFLGTAADREAMERVERAVQIVRGELAACEQYPELEHNVDALMRLQKLESGMDLIQQHKESARLANWMYPPRSAAEIAKYAAAKAAYEKVIIKSQQEWEGLAVEYRDIAGQLKVRD